MDKSRINLTREGYDKLYKEMESLKGEKRIEIARAIAEARSHGDLSENAEYDAAKDAQGMNEKRIAELELILSRAVIIDEKNLPKDEAFIGATVKVRDRDTAEEFDYVLVSEEESDFEENKISISSPVGKALLGRKVGDVVDVEVPAGKRTYEIVSINR